MQVLKYNRKPFFALFTAICSTNEFEIFDFELLRCNYDYSYQTSDAVHPSSAVMLGVYFHKTYAKTFIFDEHAFNDF